MAPNSGSVSPDDGLGRWAHKLGHQLAEESPETQAIPFTDLLDTLSETTQLLLQYPYCLPLYLFLARIYGNLGYPDLAAGAAYKALLLSDAVRDESDEYHEQATEAVEEVLARSPLPHLCRHSSSRQDKDCSDVVAAVETFYLSLIYHVLATSLLQCGCFRSAHQYCSLAVKMFPDDLHVQKMMSDIRHNVAQVSEESSLSSIDLNATATWPDQGLVRREQYQWNDFEPDRFGNLDELNAMMTEVAPKLEVVAVDLPLLSAALSSTVAERTTKQLGIFAKEDIQPGEIVLKEKSLLTANNKLQDALCDACSTDLPLIGSPDFDKTVACGDCEIVFCSQDCHDAAMEVYHPALCEKDLDAVARDVLPAQAADSLYSLLLQRALAMAETQQCHPLALKEVKYIWGDFCNVLMEKTQYTNLSKRSAFRNMPRTLPFSFEYNIRLPFHMLEKMDIDIFRNPQYDVWVFNSLYAKFRGTASARLSGLGGRTIRGPEVSAVHSMWCMANHSCDPNVSWEWGGEINFWARENRVAWQRDGEKIWRSEPGIRKGEEVFNHYCDVELGVKDRREWASGSLGGDCRCARCVWEAKEDS